MTMRWLATGLLGVLAYAAGTAQPQTASVSVTEAGGRAVLSGDTIELHLPLGGAAGPSRATAWLLSPSSTSGPQVSVVLAPGARAAEIVLPWPRDVEDKPVAGIGWYRIGYRVETAGTAAAAGVLSVGAIAPTLMALRLARPSQVMPGMPFSLRVFAGNPVTRRHYGGVSLVATMEHEPSAGSGKATAAKVVRSATTNSTGEALLTFPAPNTPGESDTVTIVATMTDTGGARTTASIDTEVKTSDRTAIHIESDKPLHKPGESVHLRALVLDGAGRAAANTAVTLSIKDPESKTLIEEQLKTNRFGIVSYDWKTTTHTATGEYSADFDIDAASDYSGSSSASIRIERYELPEFAVSAAMDKGYYLEGEVPAVYLHAAYLFGKPVAAGEVRIVPANREEWSPRTLRMDKVEAAEQTASLDSAGDAEVRLDLKRAFDDFRHEDNRRYLDVAYRAIVTDTSTGRSEPRNFTVRLTHEPVHIYLRALGSSDRGGDYLVVTSYADGAPAECRMTLDWVANDSSTTRAATVSTNRYGLAKVALRYPARVVEDDIPRMNLRLTARDRKGRISHNDASGRPETAGSIWITVDHSLLKPNEAIEAVVHGRPGSVVDVDVLSNHGLLENRQVRMAHSEEPLTVPADPAFHGVVTLWAYTMQSEAANDRHGWQDNRGAYKSVLYPEDRELKVKLTGLQASYLPGGEVQAGLDVRTASGRGIAGAFGISVFDTAVEQRAATEEDANDRWSGFNWWRDSEGIAGVSLASLNRTDMTAPVPEDLDLAAEAVLQSPGAAPGVIEANDYFAERNAYLRKMSDDLRPAGAAVLQARPVRLPGTIEDLSSIVHAAGLDDAMLLDPWLTRYKAESEVQWDDDVLRLTSAGPDKRFGNDDDLIFGLISRNLFALPGERLTNILQAEIAAGRPLPGDVDGLKQLALGGGLDLDAARDRAGRGFHYEVDVARRYYSVKVFRQSSTDRSDGTYDTSPVWTSPSIDYFSRIERRMSEALTGWSNTGHVFPDTAQQARDAFAAAGIDFDALRDPAGQGFTLRLAQVALYTRAQLVSAGVRVESTDKFVTSSLRAIQVVRRPPAATDADGENIVAQFLHPVTEQAGSEIAPHAVNGGTFKANTGAIGGTITDPSGADIHNATITVRSAEDKVAATVKSLADGSYVAADLQPGLYTVAIESPGFTDSVVREVGVFSSALTTVDVRLSVGAASSTITVTGVSPLLDTQDASIGGAPGFAATKRNAKGISEEPQFTPRLRHVFEETAFWAPSLETTSGGHAGIRFRMPDSLTTWKLHGLASTEDGRFGVIDRTFRTFQPFFVDVDAPQVLTVGDELTLPVTLRNYTAHDLSLPVTVATTDWLTLTTGATVPTHVPASRSVAANFGLRARTMTAAGPLRITAAAEREGDAVEKTVRVHPDGEPLAVNASGLLRPGAATMTLDLPAEAIPGSLHATLLLYPNLGSHVLHAMKAVLQRPYGCGEQTVSSTYPSLLYLELLKAAGASGAVRSAAQDEARTYLNLGYDRLLGYFDAGGGLTYWGGRDHEADPALTAYGIEFLDEAAPFVAVDRSYGMGAVNWLVDSQRPDGSWNPHYGNTGATLNLYIAAVIAEALRDPGNGVSAELRKRAVAAVARATAWAASSAAAAHNPYANALRLRLAAGDPAAAEGSVQRLLSELTATAVHDKQGVHWGEQTASPFYGWAARATWRPPRRCWPRSGGRVCRKTAS
jgi:hypothetical protein